MVYYKDVRESKYNAESRGKYEKSVNYRYYGTGWFLFGRVFVGEGVRGAWDYQTCLYFEYGKNRSFD